MKIFVGGLGPQVSQKAMRKLVQGALKGPWYRFGAPRGQMTECELMTMTDKRDGQVEHSSVIEISPTRLGWELLESLNGAIINGRPLRAHKWFPRDGMRDRRDILSGRTLSSGLERRERPDRRGHLRIDIPSVVRVQAVPGFERSHGA